MRNRFVPHCYRGRLALLALCGAVLVSVPSPLVAQNLTAPEVAEAPPRIDDRAFVEPVRYTVLQTTLGLRTWLSTGQSKLSYAGLDGVPDVMSELRWRRVNNPMLELSGDWLWYDRLIVRADLGLGTTGSGQLRDQDFNGSGHTDLASDSLHHANADNLYYFNLDLGWRIVTWRGFSNPGSFLAVDALLGWQHWSEKYVAQGGNDLFPGDRTFPPGDVIASRLTWDSFRIGLRSQWQINEQWSIESRAFFVPYTDFENSDIHYLRTDLLQDPSFLDRAHGGIGVMADVTAVWRVTPQFGLELGYRIWDVRSDSGYSITRTSDTDFVSPLNHATTLRHGVLLGLNWRF